MKSQPEVVVDNVETASDEAGSDAEEHLPSEIDLDDGNIDIPQPAGPKL